jgi:flagellar basal-body rod modification protein FlgD
MADPLLITSTNPVVAASNPNSATSKSTPTTSGDAVTKNMFMQLLVAQIKNQDPLNPTDGVQFLTQLAQFQQLEQSMNMSQDMTAARNDLDKIVQINTGSQGTDAPASQTN